MNELVEQFLVESRELVQQATAELLALEKSPGDKEKLDGAFRAFHTLKGGAGIVDFAAMEAAVHAAENVLSDARAGSRAISTDLIGDCLRCLDQVARWLDAMQGDGEMPGTADAEAKALIAHFARSQGKAVTKPADARSETPADWEHTLLARQPALREHAVTAVRYLPDPDCFFRGEDPLALMGAIPGLLAIEFEPALPWPALDQLDPFSCNLVLLALCQSGTEEVRTALGHVIGQCDIRPLSGVAQDSAVAALQRRTRDLLAAQIALLEDPAPQGLAGRIASAGQVAVRALRFLGKTQEADGIAKAAQASQAGNTADPLRRSLQAYLDESSRVPAASPRPAQEAPTRTLRVDASRIDALANLVGELTVAKNAAGHVARLAQEQGNGLAAVLKDRHAVLDRLVGEIQRAVVGMRVLPLRYVFQRFPRLVREIALDLGKPASLVIEGDDTEADKVIVEMIFEPLLHVLRNAIDHGIENASERAAVGKAQAATIYLRASRMGEHVVVEVQDDGRGIDIANIRRVAQARKLVPADVLAAMDDEEITALIFLPGFSTSDAITGLSGRGVGMDAVRSAVQRMGGALKVESHAGAGTTVRFTLPFSVMMTRVMTVQAGGQMFAIPLDAVVETVRVDARRIAPVGAAKAIVLRNQTIPLVELADALGVACGTAGEADATVVVTRTQGQLGALQVDRLGERMEVMLRPLDGLLAGMQGIAGSTLLGDGSVLLVLDIGELVQ